MYHVFVEDLVAERQVFPILIALCGPVRPYPAVSALVGYFPVLHSVWFRVTVLCPDRGPVLPPVGVFANPGVHVFNPIGGVSGSLVETGHDDELPACPLDEPRGLIGSEPVAVGNHLPPVHAAPGFNRTDGSFPFVEVRVCSPGKTKDRETHFRKVVDDLFVKSPVLFDNPEPAVRGYHVVAHRRDLVQDPVGVEGNGLSGNMQ